MKRRTFLQALAAFVPLGWIKRKAEAQSYPQTLTGNVEPGRWIFMTIRVDPIISKQVETGVEIESTEALMCITEHEGGVPISQQIVMSKLPVWRAASFWLSRRADVSIKCGDVFVDGTPLFTTMNKQIATHGEWQVKQDFEFRDLRLYESREDFEKDRPLYAFRTNVEGVSHLLRGKITGTAVALFILASIASAQTFDDFYEYTTASTPGVGGVVAPSIPGSRPFERKPSLVSSLSFRHAPAPVPAKPAAGALTKQVALQGQAIPRPSGKQETWAEQVKSGTAGSGWSTPSESKDSRVTPRARSWYSRSSTSFGGSGSGYGSSGSSAWTTGSWTRSSGTASGYGSSGTTQSGYTVTLVPSRIMTGNYGYGSAMRAYTVYSYTMANGYSLGGRRVGLFARLFPRWAARVRARRAARAQARAVRSAAYAGSVW